MFVTTATVHFQRIYKKKNADVCWHSGRNLIDAQIAGTLFLGIVTSLDESFSILVKIHWTIIHSSSDSDINLKLLLPKQIISDFGNLYCI